MEFTLEFYKSRSGKSPVRDFLNNLKDNDPDDFVAVLAGLAKLKNRKYHRPPLSKALGEDLFELRHVGKLNTRILYFFLKGRRIILVHGIRNKDTKVPSRVIKVAKQRKQDWYERYSG